jgi:uncharacterized membrane protein
MEPRAVTEMSAEKLMTVLLSIILLPISCSVVSLWYANLGQPFRENSVGKFHSEGSLTSICLLVQKETNITECELLKLGFCRNLNKRLQKLVMNCKGNKLR